MENKGVSLIYTAITVLCIVLCLFLAGIMAAGKGESTTSQTEKQHFSEVKIVEEKREEILISAEYLSEKLGAMLPEAFPEDSVKVEINGNGTIYTGMDMTRQNIEGMVKDGLGVKEKLMLRMLPDRFEMGVWFTVSPDEETGMLTFSVSGFNLNGMRSSSSMLPAEVTHDIAQAVNKVLLDSGYYFTKIEITDGAVRLLP